LSTSPILATNTALNRARTRIRRFSILSRFWSLDEGRSCKQILVPKRRWGQFYLPEPVFGI